MAYQVLSRKWRPKKFQDVVGQSHITQSLINSLKLDKLGHAYLFTGTRGIGKTTVARIFGKALRCESLLEDGNPCTECPSCKDFETGSSMNVYEIDGASNNSVDDIRELISNVQYLPTTGKYKVYIIDEIHMLSTSAFNALLKTLEEPPEHVLFLFATTEPHKLLETVLSRCQRFDFKNATSKEISFLINKIAKEENISFESEEVLNQLSIQGKGSFRDTLSLLDQVLSFSLDGKIDDEILSNALGLALQTELQSLTEAVMVGDGNLVSETYRKMLNKNVSLENILRGLQDHFFKIIDSIDNKEKVEKFIDIKLLEQFSMPELFWIYESLAKDTSWTLKSLSAEDASELAIKKVCFRRDFFKGSGQKIKFGDKQIASVPDEEIKLNEIKEEIPQELNESSENIVIKEELVQAITESTVLINETEPVVNDVPEVVVENIEESKTYKNFLAYIYSKSPASASNLEQGNIIGEPILIENESVRLEITFGQASKVFYDFLSETEVYNKINQYLADYYNLPIGKSILNLNLLEDKVASEEFVSVADIKKIQAKEELNIRENNIRNNPMLQEVEKAFASKVDKVILNKEE